MSVTPFPGYYVPDVYEKHLLEKEWCVLVFHESDRARPAFSLWKYKDKYIVRLRGWVTQQQFDTLPEAIQMGCLKHRLGVTDGPRCDGPDQQHR